MIAAIVIAMAAVVAMILMALVIFLELMNDLIDKDQ